MSRNGKSVLTFKKILFLNLILCMTFSSSAWSLDGSGKIEEIMMCHLGASSGDWKGHLLFRLDGGSWFGVYADFIGSPKTDYDNNIDVSLVMSAFSQGLLVNVRANYLNGTFCGHSASIMWNTSGDYIHIIK